jgi:(R,R)-butanediol dehydrogenase/meso-butanediol dehydrogenase/diacetyl reductase
MLAAVWHGIRDIRVESIPLPDVGPSDIRVRVALAGVCGTDIEEYTSGPVFIPTHPHPMTARSAPLVLGHEFCGTVIDVGSAVTNIAVGQRVACQVIRSCGACDACVRGLTNRCVSAAVVGLMSDGGLAEFAVFPARLAAVLPDSVDDINGAQLEPAAVAVHAARRAQVTSEDRVVVFGAGAVGLLCAQIVRHSGAARVVVVDPSAERRDLALVLGADGAVAPFPQDDATAEAVSDALHGRATVAIEATGIPAVISTSLRSTGRGGRVVLLGQPAGTAEIRPLDLVEYERTLLGSFAHVMEPDFVEAVDLMASGAIQVGSYISAIVPLAEVVERVFEPLATRSATGVKYLIDPNDPRL